MWNAQLSVVKCESVNMMKWNNNKLENWKMRGATFSLLLQNNKYCTAGEKYEI